MDKEQEPFDMNDHPPHRLCECRKCMEYFTPLPDCDAFAAGGKPITGHPWYDREDSTNALAKPDWEAIDKEQLRRYKEKFGDFEQAEQEPVAWMYEYGTDRGDAVNEIRWYPNLSFIKPSCLARNVRPLYATPVRTKDLTDDFINELHKDAQDPISFARAVIAADREKNRG